MYLARGGESSGQKCGELIRRFRVAINDLRISRTMQMTYIVMGGLWLGSYIILHVDEITKAEAFIQVNPITNSFPD